MTGSGVASGGGREGVGWAGGGCGGHLEIHKVTISTIQIFAMLSVIVFLMAA